MWFFFSTKGQAFSPGAMPQGLSPNPKLGRSPLSCRQLSIQHGCSIITLKTRYGRLGCLLTLAGLRGTQGMAKGGNQVDGVDMEPFPPMWDPKKKSGNRDPADQWDRT